MIHLTYDIVGVTAYLDPLIDKIYFAILLPLNPVLYCLEDNSSLEAELFGRIAECSLGQFKWRWQVQTIRSK